jgi:hypothetical protein
MIHVVLGLYAIISIIFIWEILLFYIDIIIINNKKKELYGIKS